VSYQIGIGHTEQEDGRNPTARLVPAEETANEDHHMRKLIAVAAALGFLSATSLPVLAQDKPAAPAPSATAEKPMAKPAAKKSTKAKVKKAKAKAKAKVKAKAKAKSKAKAKPAPKMDDKKSGLIVYRA
jgi:hypothetical protein